MIYTTYFAKLKKLPEDVVPIAICAKPPAWFDGLCYKQLAPKYGFFMEYKRMVENNDPNAEDYYDTHYHKEVLNVLDADDVVSTLYALAEGKDFAMVCFEKDGDFCHRRLASNWLQRQGYRVEEFDEEIHLNMERWE